MRDSFRAVILTGVIHKAFFQVCICAQDCDAFRFHWIDKEDPLRIHTYRFTKALFGLGPSPFLLGGVIKQHLKHCRADHPECVDDNEHELYVDNLLTGGLMVEKAKEKKALTTATFGQVTICLHK